MDLDEYRIEVINEVESKSLYSSQFPEDIFLEDFCVDVLIEDYGLMSDLDVLHYEMPSTSPKFRSMSIDAASVEPAINTMSLVYCDYNSGDPTPITTEIVNSKISLLENYVSNVLKGFFYNAPDSSPATELARNILNNIDVIGKLQLIFVSTNIKAERLKREWHPDPLVVGNKTIDVTVFVIDIENIYQSKMIGSDREKIVIETKDFGLPEGIPCIKAEIESDDYDSYLAIVPGSFLSDIYLKYNARLLENNVRSFLNTRGEINKGIQHTILGEQSRFFAYNNGIATTADSVEIVTRNNGTYITKFNNLQIINGGQTTASLAYAVLKNNADLSGIYVQMKLSIIKNQENASEIVMLISRYANKQNKVTNADLDSNHPYFVRIEELSNRVKSPQLGNQIIQTRWFFERSRGQYDQARMRLSSKSERDNFERLNPKSQKFTKTDLAKYINSADELPYYVSLGAEKNLTKFFEKMDRTFEKDDFKYNEVYFKDLIAKCIIFKTIDSMILHSDWYKEDAGYKAPITTYTFAKFVHEVKQKKLEINYNRIWNQQSVINEYMVDLANIAILVHDALNDPHRETSNIGEYAKTSGCWDVISKIPYSLSDGTCDNLVGPDYVKESVRSSARQQKLTNNVSDEVAAYNAGIQYWQGILKLNESLNFLNYLQVELIGKMIKFITNGRPALTSSDYKELGSIMRAAEKDYNIHY